MTEEDGACTILHEDRLDRIKADFPSSDDLDGAGEIFRLLGDPGRLRIVRALSAEELCVCDLAHFLGASSSAVSHQLKLLKDARVVKNRREGKVVYYRLDDDHVTALVVAALEHAREPRPSK